MTIFPDFKFAHRRELATLGLSEVQIEELRKALIPVRAYLRPPARNNDTAALLSDIYKLADKLSRKLNALTVYADEEHQTAGVLIAKRYWSDRPTDDGPTVALHLCPRLDVLAAAAHEAKATLPKGKPVRYKAGSPEPVRRIAEALFSGWIKVHGPVSATWVSPNDEAEELAVMSRYASTNPPELIYPDTLRPSTSAGSVFRRIVSICYEAVGKNPDPERALKAYVAEVQAERRDAMAGLERGLVETRSESKKSRRRTERARLFDVLS